MPFRAFINGQEVIALEVTTTQWQTYQKDRTKVVTMSCCQNRGILKTSHKGLQFFAHHPDNPKPLNCSYKGETEQHLRAKMAIRNACLELAGVACNVEVSGQGWRADVLAIKGNRKIAFEIQWSPQNIVETQIRQERYRQSGVECVWLFRIISDLSPNPSLPIFQLIETGGEFKVKVESHYLSLEDFVKAWLNGQIQYCTYLQSSTYQKINIGISSCFCAKCQEKNHYFQILNSIYPSECSFPVERNQSKRTKLEFRPEIVQIIQKFLEQQEQEDLYLANIEFYYLFSQKIWRFTCCWCGTPINEDNEPECIAILEHKIRFNPLIADQAFPHWCWSKSALFCNQPIVSNEPQQSVIWIEGRKKSNSVTNKKSSIYVKKEIETKFFKLSTTEIEQADLPISIENKSDSPISSWNTYRCQDEISTELKPIWDLIYNSLPQKYEGFFRCSASLKSFDEQIIIIDLIPPNRVQTLNEYMQIFLITCQTVFQSKSLRVKAELLNSREILWDSQSALIQWESQDVVINLSQIWQHFLDQIPSNHNSLRQLLKQHGNLLEIQKSQVIISLSSQPLIKRVKMDEFLIKEIFEKCLEQSVDVAFILQ
ncbi:hypothetical protein C7H19_18300 [Aphanothece hegewaldii CCALA 016]|uniref:Competence protein CoiA n=1 Tax=Aphanothece hegewaldii CCALA 016 TaxID=2107694 RepID=A0A2T1LU38_9CHRO|nr:hypothetical protein [Aphanothece hegewaldii]PSF34957.1 hypothetical protein C7H19_18300 [Aphanothece hegewaldii CCALA 016]